MKHIKNNNTTYWKHWWTAMSCSIALFIHAWFPDILVTYASDKICPKNETAQKKPH